MNPSLAVGTNKQTKKMRKQWTQQELKALRGVNPNDKGLVTQLAKELNRSERSVLQKLYYLASKKRKPRAKADTENVVVTQTHVYIKNYTKLCIVGKSLNIKL